MEKRKDIIEFIHKLIDEENGVLIGLEDTVDKACLDSLGTVFFLIELDNKYKLFGGSAGVSGNSFEGFKPSSVTLKELVNLCKVSSKSK